LGEKQGDDEDAVTAWSRLFQDKADADVEQGIMWIPSGLGLGLGLDLGYTDNGAAVDMSFLPPSVTTTTSIASTSTQDDFFLSPSTGIMQTLFDHSGYLFNSSHLDSNTTALEHARGRGGTEEPPLSAISSSDFIIPGFLDFPASASVSSCGTSADTSVFLDEAGTSIGAGVGDVLFDGNMITVDDVMDGCSTVETSV
jgi:hypothetical protein